VRGPDGSYQEAFAFRSGGGELMMLVLMPDTYTVGVRKTTLTLPSVGQLNEAMVLQLETASNPFFQIGDVKNAVTSVDVAQGRYTRSSIYNRATGVSRPETIAINDPSAGFSRRLPATVTDSSGASSTVRETVTLNLPGAGLSVTAFVGGTALQLALSK
jgi:hypothetical protein